MSQSPKKTTIEKQLLTLPIIQKLVSIKTNTQLHKLFHLLQHHNTHPTHQNSRMSSPRPTASTPTPAYTHTPTLASYPSRPSMFLSPPEGRQNRQYKSKQKKQIHLPITYNHMIFFISGKMEIFRKKKDNVLRTARTGTINSRKFSKQLTIQKQIQNMESSSLNDEQNSQQFHQLPQIQIQLQKKQQQLQITTIDKPGHYFLEPNHHKISVHVPSIFYTLNEKNTIQIFESIMPLPFIQSRMKQLRNVELFNNMQRKKIIKICGSVQEKFLFIGNKIQTQFVEEDDHGRFVKKYCYFIVEGEVVIFRDGIAVSILGPRQIFGAPTKQEQFVQHRKTIQHHQQHLFQHKLKGSIGKVRTSTAHLFQIPAQLLLQNNKKITQHVNQRIKWRQNRVIRITKLTQKQKQKREVKMQEKASFIDKQIVFKSFYGKNIEHLKKMKHYCTKDQLKCQSRQQFYGKKLDSIKRMQKQRYGQDKTIILFPIPLGRYITNMAKTVGISTSPDEKQKQSRQTQKFSATKRRYSQNRRNKTQTSGFSKCETPSKFNRTNVNFFTTHI